MNARRVIAAPVALMLLTACGSPQEAAPTASSASSSASSASTSSVPAADGAGLAITIAGGEVTPVNAELEAEVGQPITLTVTSDAEDELHVHAIPERTFQVRPGTAETFEFTADVPGRVEVELHHLHRIVVTIQVRP